MSIARGIATSIVGPIAGGRGGLTPPSGFVFLVDSDGAYLVDDDGAYLIEAE